MDQNSGKVTPLRTYIKELSDRPICEAKSLIRGYLPDSEQKPLLRDQLEALGCDQLRYPT
jgi:hypothetical protein